MCHRDDDSGRRGVTRRGFLGSVSAGAVVAATGLGGRGEAAVPQDEDSSGLVPVSLEINRRQHRLLVEPRWSLLYVLREGLGLTGTKLGCERGECGACTVLIDDQPRYACMMLAVEAAGRHITTLEGLLEGEQLGPVQRAFVTEDALQCGYCTPGQIVAAEGLLRANPAPSSDEIRVAMAGNLCRCAAYTHIERAVALAATLKAGGA